LIIAKYYL